jgi:hypothetical protein
MATLAYQWVTKKVVPYYSCFVTSCPYQLLEVNREEFLITGKLSEPTSHMNAISGESNLGASHMNIISIESILGASHMNIISGGSNPSVMR